MNTTFLHLISFKSLCLHVSRCLLATQLAVLACLLARCSSLSRGRLPRVLVMLPTRELAIQVHKEFELIATKQHKAVCIYGGAAYSPQEGALRQGVDVVVGTTGRIKVR